MKYTDFDKVESLRKQLINCQEGVRAIYEYQEENPDENGYSFYLSRQSDGSGKIADLAGCYIADESLQAIEQVLRQRIADVQDELTALGVEFGI